MGCKWTIFGRRVSITNLFIVTTQAEFASAGIAELQQLDQQTGIIEELAPGITLCNIADVSAFMHKVTHADLIFVRHLAPAQAVIDLDNTEQDIGNIATALAALPTFSILERGIRFSIQTRFAQTDKSLSKRPYSSGNLNKTLADAFAEEAGAIESIKKPQVVVSILCTAQKSYLGISPVEENLSSWPGGMRHYAHIPEEISRAEFKLLEALEIFGVDLPEGKLALDLGAAPGGWTRLFLEAQMRVVAADPAQMDPRIATHSRLKHYQGYAEECIEEAYDNGVRFSIIANDMRMDARDAARVLGQAAKCLQPGGFVISTLKLPHETGTMHPLSTMKQALHILNQHYGLIKVKQLFHNRQEVTILAAQPLLTRK